MGYADITGDAYYHAFLYSGGSMHDLGTLLGGKDSKALDINNKGQVVGEGNISSGYDHAFIFTGSGPIEDLNNLIDPASGWTLEDAYGINDLGQIVGGGYNSLGQGHAFLLTPVPRALHHRSSRRRCNRASGIFLATAKTGVGQSTENPSP